MNFRHVKRTKRKNTNHYWLMQNKNIERKKIGERMKNVYKHWAKGVILLLKCTRVFRPLRHTQNVFRSVQSSIWKLVKTCAFCGHQNLMSAAHVCSAILHSTFIIDCTREDNSSVLLCPRAPFNYFERIQNYNSQTMYMCNSNA